MASLPTSIPDFPLNLWSFLPSSSDQNPPNPCLSRASSKIWGPAHAVWCRTPPLRSPGTLWTKAVGPICLRSFSGRFWSESRRPRPFGRLGRVSSLAPECAGAGEPLLRRSLKRRRFPVGWRSRSLSSRWVNFTRFLLILGGLVEFRYVWFGFELIGNFGCCWFVFIRICCCRYKVFLLLRVWF